MRFSSPPVKTVELKIKATSPTPRSLRAFCCQLNQGDNKVAIKIRKVIRVDPKIPLIAAIFMILIFFCDCLINAAYPRRGYLGF